MAPPAGDVPWWQRAGPPRDGGVWASVAWSAALSGADETLARALRWGAPRDARGRDGGSLVHLAVLHPWPMAARVLEVLAAHSAPLTLQDRDGDMPAHLALRLGRMEALAWLLRHGVPPDAPPGRPLLFAAPDDAVAAGALLAAGARPDAPDGEGATLLHRTRSVEVAEALVAAGAVLHATDRVGRTPLQRAVDRGDARMATWLRYRGVASLAAGDGGA